MKVAIMQPYFFPYIGYFQLISAVDVFVVYDNIKYTKKGWINRNRMLQNEKDVMFSLPLKAASDFECVSGRELAADFSPEKLLNQLSAAYRRAPQFAEILPLVERIIRCAEGNLFRYLLNSITSLVEHLGIQVKVVTSSAIDINHDLKSQDKVIAICKALGADVYINAIGGLELYSKEDFSQQGIELAFIKPRPFVYNQFGGEFVPWLSIIDVLMFNSQDVIDAVISSNYELV